MLTRQWLIPFSSPVAWTKRQILRKSIPPRMKRVQWTCACGVSLYDDYEELMSGAAANFETCLQAASSHNRQRQNVGSDDQTDMAAPRHKDLRGVLTNILGLSSQKLRRTTQGELPSFELRSEIPEQTTTSNEPSPKALFLLVCMNDSIGDSVIKLQQLSVHDIESDRKLFKVLGQMYATNRYRWWSFLSLWSLKRINFVNFDVYAKFLVDIKDLHVVPPDNEHSYLYQRSGLKPPIGSNLLMHYMRCPQDATILTPCLEKVPKKVDGKLQVCPVKGVTPGWGLHFIEGWHWKRIFLGSFFAFLASAITVAITCRHLGRSVQDAMAISSFMLACFALSVGALQAWLNMV
ncbi:hypothetical protein DL98DRAFT_513915 [Cadophora sp. DSE1049]|nr:hypothetical protein DL98DRAFT_513915 [Cadophora sp. DSE1049]